MEKTKKMLDSISFGDVTAKREEFLIPNPLGGGTLIGIKSGKVAIYGAICYTGIDVFLSNIIDKMKANKIDIPNENDYQIVLRRFIDELYQYKIGNVITSSQDSQGNLILIKVAERERPTPQISLNKADFLHDNEKDSPDGNGSDRQVKGWQEESHKPELSKEEKKALVKKWKATQKKKYILSKIKAQKLFRYLEAQLEATPCDNTLHFTEQWLEDNIPQEKIENIITEIKDMGGYCDCEVLFNCYDKYDIRVN